MYETLREKFQAFWAQVKALFESVWAYLSHEDMVLNLTSELIGILFALIVVSAFGGWLVRRINTKIFDTKWHALRVEIAETILEGQEQLDAEFFYLGTEMKRVSEKAIEDLNQVDKDIVLEKKALCIDRTAALVSILEKYHFALREKDLEPMLAYISSLRREISGPLQNYHSEFEQFDAMLSTHLQGTNSLNDPIFSKEPEFRRHDILVASAKGANKLIEEMDRVAVLTLGRRVAVQLIS